ncbi:MAG: LemA family protein [Clostridia bacterium]|nr:LemA family protein [Clostridia bacterium]
MGLIIFIVVIVLLVLWVVSVYNGLVKERMKVKNSWSQIDVQLQRRFDLIPNLVETVKGYMQHESDVLTKVTELRTSWANAKTVKEKANLDNQLSESLKTIMAVSENYPDLKANSSFTELQEELRNTENKISYSRQFYNDSVTRYNIKVQTVPSNIIAGLFHFELEEFFKAESEEARQNVKVSF